MRESSSAVLRHTDRPRVRVPLIDPVANVFLQCGDAWVDTQGWWARAAERSSRLSSDHDRKGGRRAVESRSDDTTAEDKAEGQAAPDIQRLPTLTGQ